MEKSNTRDPDFVRGPSSNVTPPTDPITSSDEDSSNTGTKAEDDADKYEYTTGVKLAIVMASVTLVAFLVMLDQSIVSTAVPRITSDFHSLPDVGWYGSAYLMSSASLQPLTGKFYTYFGSKYTFLKFLAIFELGALLCGVANSSHMFIIGRAIAGLGSSGLVNGALTIIAACVPLVKRPMYLGIMMGVSQLGIVLGPLIGGVLTQYATWRWCFYVNLPMGAATAILLLAISIPDRTIKYESLRRLLLEKMDFLGFALFGPAAIQCLLALEWGGNGYAWDSATVIGLFCGAAGTISVFLVWENLRGDEAMIPLSMVRRRIVWSSSLVMFFFFGSLLTLSYYLPIYFQAVKGVSPTLSGVDLLPSILSQMLFAILSGFLVGKLGYYLPWSIASAILTSIGAGLISTFNPTTSTGEWIGYQVIVGVGRGCGLQMPIVAIQNTLPASQLSVAMSLLIFTQTFGGALFLASAQTAFTSGLQDALKTYAPNVDAQTLLVAGAARVRDVVSKGELEGVLVAYNLAVRHTFFLAAGLAAATGLACWGMGWKDIRVKEEEKVTAV